MEIVQFKDGVEISRCLENDPSIAGQIKASKELTLSKCSVKGQMIILTPKKKGGTDPSAQVTESDYFNVNFIADGGVSLLSYRKPTGNDGKIHILFDANWDDGKSAFQTTSANQALCDQNASPLFVDMRSDYEKIQQFSLRAPWDGVLFDILGKNADPVPHTPNRISWFKSSAMAYIALPNRRGQVLGIDQLFGDNTLGPDGEFSPNGYAALAKHDLNKDQVINSEDPVYRKLKIWQDHNHDGVAAASELTSLSDAQIEVIDLRYDEGFSEEDVYGNSIKYKSVVKMTNGEYRLVFDIWFELNLYKARQRFYEVAGR